MYGKTQPPVFTPKGVLDMFYQIFALSRYFSNLNAKIFLGIPISFRARV